MGWNDFNQFKSHGKTEVVAICDVDSQRLARASKEVPDARTYTDWRELLAAEEDKIDSVNVTVPDHMHFSIAMNAVQAGKHVYCQKPLTHTVSEARILTKLAREHKVATQMGNQGHSNPDSRRLVELIQAGVLGEVKEAHVWTNRPVWPQGIDRPKDTLPVPDTLDWDLWLGTAPERPYHSAYVPFKWRGWWDFGTGALGDMGCHNQDLAYWALELRDPTSVEAKSSEVNNETAPKWSEVTYQFPKTKKRGPVKLTWYDGGKKPDPALAKEKPLPANGSIIIGTKDTLYVPMYWGPGRFLSGAKLEDFKNVPEHLPKPKDFGRHHYQEWIDACKGGKPAYSNFDYAGPMTESVLLANVALRAAGKIEWDAKKMRVTNLPEANQYVTHKYRGDWKL